MGCWYWGSRAMNRGFHRGLVVPKDPGNAGDPGALGVQPYSPGGVPGRSGNAETRVLERLVRYKNIYILSIYLYFHPWLITLGELFNYFLVFSRAWSGTTKKTPSSLSATMAAAFPGTGEVSGEMTTISRWKP